MRVRPVAATAVTTLVGAGAAAVAAGRYASDVALRPVPGRPLPGEPALTVHAVDGDRVTLTRSIAALRRGTYGLTARGLHAVVGPVVEDAPHPADCVVRRLERVTHGVLEPGARVWLTPQVHLGNPRDALGLDHADVAVPGELGPLPAWFVPGDRDTWVITVHGLGTTREHPMVVMPFLHRQRLPVLDLGYRGDPGAPRSPDGIGRFGAAEWRDLDAAIRYAVRYGARHVVLHGWSTGATMALLAASESGVRDRVGGLVLDSPVLDWPATLRALAAARRLPAALVPLAVRAAQGRTGLDPDALARAVDPARPDVPTLIVHGPDDTLAPWHASRELAARRPGLIHLHAVRHAPHAAMWNAHPAGYEESLRRFLIPLM
ncbi:alpha/beta hydrolase [Streptomyces sp. HU2014]|uniref:alpha/beta hydrolase n=1 Tax=Streptomyces sp. HU2014 TaxID=2939414 RepID=UPI0020104BDF|nr:alpha/beta hydrolase [Streptomyces sp. HU2014]UQI44229.1 alpha/beta hydrolase [Streptomyces sp. HU2014]